MTPQEYQDCISSNAVECESMTRLLQGLLFLARAENRQTVISAKPFQVQEMFNTITDYFGDGAAAPVSSLPSATRRAWSLVPIGT